ncbi:ATP-binding protein [Streptomyces sp. JJ66]|uniref:ATP-binding protein n=1 Tax=Streptomyces sp. JJ66 TaxID=2803843 RepID=UPI001C59F0BD|nr:ATP-binding protein [Streptomyces sp. JJ66]MBW1603815.1 ATP-binding protein [Streptomyces sp. JJ66]
MDEVSQPLGEQLGTMTLHPRADSVSTARRWFRKLIAPYPLARSLDDCVLLLSELVTNALLHGDVGTEDRIRVEWHREGTALRVCVHNPGPPPQAVRLRHPRPDQPHGRGLLLVSALADSWDTAPSPFGGTAVCFTLADALPAP